MGYNKNMDNDDYIRINEEGLAEVNPTASSDAQMAFIDAYRAAQGENTAQIGEQAHALGSDLEAQYGGLHGPSEYWKSRYQAPQTESRVAGLRSAAQLSALNNLMQNDLANWKNRYSNAYKAAQKRASSGGSEGSTPTTTDTTTGGVDEIVTDGSVGYSSSATNVPGLTVNNETYVDADGNYITRNMDTGEVLYVNGYSKATWDRMQARSVGRGVGSGIEYGSGGGGGW